MEDVSKLNLEKDLQCTICLELSVSPIHSCRNGHIVCGLCSDKVKKCGMCRKGGLAKCGFAEQLAEKYVMKTYCKNYESGCKIIIKSTQVKAHLPLCEYRSIRCFETEINVCETAYFEMREFKDHLEGHHKTPMLEAKLDGEYEFSICSSGLQNQIKFGRCSVLLCEKNGQNFVVHVGLDRTALCWWITVLGGQTEAEKYYYTTQLTSSSKHIEQNWKLPVLPYHKFDTFEKVVETGYYLSMSYKMILAAQENPLAPNENRNIDLGFKIQTKSVDCVMKLET